MLKQITRGFKHIKVKVTKNILLLVGSFLAFIIASGIVSHMKWAVLTLGIFKKKEAFWGRRGDMARKSAKDRAASSQISLWIAIIFLAFFLLKILPRLKFWVDDTSAWVFFLVFIIFLIKPIHHWIKNKN